MLARDLISASDAASQRGFTMIEVLIAILVLSIGLLGLAGLQATGLRNNHQAYQRSIATQQVYDMADRMRVNPAGVVANAYDAISGIPTNPGCTGSTCTPAGIAAYDAAQWNSANAALLPSGAGTVTSLGGGVFTITVRWDELKTVGATTGFALSGATTDFALTFRPAP